MLSRKRRHKETSIKELDSLCRRVVFRRDGRKCRRCGKESGLLDWAHVFSRRNKRLRWDPVNSLVLCRGCHMNFWHQRPLEAAEWFRNEVGQREYDYLIAASRGVLKRSNYPLVKLDLERRLESNA